MAFQPNTELSLPGRTLARRDFEGQWHYGLEKPNPPLLWHDWGIYLQQQYLLTSEHPLNTGCSPRFTRFNSRHQHSSGNCDELPDAGLSSTQHVAADRSVMTAHVEACPAPSGLVLSHLKGLKLPLLRAEWHSNLPAPGPELNAKEELGTQEHSWLYCPPSYTVFIHNVPSLTRMLSLSQVHHFTTSDQGGRVV